MSVIVDMSIGSLALRRNDPNPAVAQQLQTLNANGQVTMLGAIRQEILSGIRSLEQFESLQNELRAFPDLELISENYELAAAFFNTCRQSGCKASTQTF